MKTKALIGGLLFVVAQVCYGQLRVDFDAVDATGALVANSATEFGLESYGAQNQTSGQPFDLFRTVTFNTASWGNINVTLSSDANPAGSDFVQAARAIARTAGQVGTYNGTLVDLVRDWVGVDTRSTNAGATTLNFQISGLPAGNFELVSYHQDPENQSGQFNVLLNGALVATNVDIRGSSAGENPGTGNPPNFIVTPFTSDGSTPATISFQMTTTNSANVVDRIFVLNGFVLANRGQGLLVYDFDGTPATAFPGTAVTLSWVVRTNSTVTVDLVGDVTSRTTNGVGSVSVTPSDFAAPGTTLTYTLVVQDNSTGEFETRALPIQVRPDIASFNAAPQAIHGGDTTILSWTVNPLVTSVAIDQGVGSVNARTTNGVGSIALMPSATTTYNLTVDRAGNISQTNLTVVVVPPGGTGTLTNSLVSYWPMDELLGTKTPDVVSGYDLTAEGATLPALVAGGYRSNAFQFFNSGILSRIHALTDQLPANKHDSFTISLWAMVNGAPQDDRRVFSEGSTTDNDPLFNLGTQGGLPNGIQGSQMSVFIRRPNGVVENNHSYTAAQPFDNTWHHVVFVQSNGVRTVYVDAVQDSTAIADKAPAEYLTNTFNTTSVGGIRRAAISAQTSGFVDDVAIWKRALSPSEIGEVFLDGMPTSGGSSGPLAINTFVADFPAVVTGDTVTLRWDTSPDASLSIDNGIGNVDSVSSFGVGSIAVQVNAPAQFTLTATRGADTPVTAMVSVTVVNGVATGWHLVDNFETYQPGPILGQSKWNNGTGVASVLDRGGNKVFGFTQTAPSIVGQGLVSAINLDSLSVVEGETATLFFRIYASTSDMVSLMALHAGLTDRGPRFVNDFDNDVGPYLRLFKPATEVTNVSLLAPNGVGIAFTNASEALEHGTIYNVWLNVTNDLIASNDLFSVYLQEEGQSGRTLLFENLRGDRNPAGDETGAVLPTLNKVFFVLLGLNQGIESLLIDDIYISDGGYLDTVPMPAAAFENTIRLSSPSRSAGGFIFSWNSELGSTYTVRAKTNLMAAWQILVTNYPTGGATGPVTSYTNSPLPNAQRFYQAVAEPRPAIWSTDLESGTNGWTVVDNSFGNSPTVWEWGTPANGPGAAHSGTRAFGTDLDANYAQFTDTLLRSPIIDLTGVTNQVRLEFWQYVNVEQTDVCQVNILDQFDTPIATPVSTQSGSNGGWKLLTYPLPTTILNQPIRIEFRMADLDLINAQSLPGWFIDDVAVRRQ